MDYPVSHLHFVSIQTRLKAHTCVNQENTTEKWDILWYATTEHCITVLYHVIQNTVAKNIHATCAAPDGKVWV